MSRHSAIAEEVKQVAAAWAATNWGTATVKRGWVVEALGSLVSNAEPIVIAVVPTAVTDNTDIQGSRGTDGDLIDVSIIIMGRADGIETTDLDVLDDKTEALRDHLRKFRFATSGAYNFNLDNIALTTAFDHESLSQQELWASLIVAQYSCDVPSLPGVSQE